MARRKSNKQVKAIIVDALNQQDGINKMFRHVWDGSPCLICFKNANFMWVELGTVSIKANQEEV